jgi:hypothetical protein
MEYRTGGCSRSSMYRQRHEQGNYVSAIFAKLEVSDRTQAAVIAIQHGLGKI